MTPDEKVKPKVGERERNQVWAAWNLLREFSLKVKDDWMYTSLDGIAEHLEEYLEASE